MWFRIRCLVKMLIQLAPCLGGARATISEVLQKQSGKFSSFCFGIALASIFGGVPAAVSTGR
jgi:hypothetical protein